MTITNEQLLKIVPTVSPKIVDTVVKLVNQYANEYGLVTTRRMAMFLANVAHESGAFKFVREIWGPTEAQKKYEGRKDLGNIEPGDGKKYMGRGYIQLTGRDVYREFSKYAFDDEATLLVNPAQLEAPSLAMESAMWFWAIYKPLNTYADKPDTWRDPSKKLPPFEYVCYRINGGSNGLAERKQYYATALKVLK